MWTVIGIAGIAAALAGPAVNRLGLTHSWISAMAPMAAAGCLFALLAAQPVAATTAAAAFGAAYIALTGILLVWATRLFPDRASFGVGISFLFIAVGQGRKPAQAPALQPTTTPRAVSLSPDLDDARGPYGTYYLKKRNQGRTHSQAVIALARRRIDVPWALLRDNRTWSSTPPTRAQAA